MTCTCGYEFCFDPKQDGMTDGKFLAAIRSASFNDTQYFTENQLYSAMCRKQVKSPMIPLILAAVFVTAAVVVGLAFDVFPALLVFRAFGLFALATGLARLVLSAPMKEQFARNLGKWKNRRKEFGNNRLLEQPRLGETPPEWKEQDIYDYGVEGVLLVERDLLVDLLVLNGFHTANRVLVMCESGYPKYLLPLAARMLEENAELPVFLLHDSTPHGVQMAARLGKSSPLPIEGHDIIDLGVTPDDVKRLRRLRPTRPQANQYAVPVDLLMYGALFLALTRAITEKAPMALLIAHAHQGGGDDGAYVGFG